MPQDMVLDDIVVDLGRNHVYTLVPFRDGFFAMYRGNQVDPEQFVGYFPQEVLADPRSLQDYHPTFCFANGYWTYSRCRQMAQALGQAPEGPVWSE